jgi:RNA polymerase subunit RPABC4/transcription elongation factor Spt4
VEHKASKSDRALEGAELSARLCERFSGALLSRRCLYCGAGFIAAPETRFCPICGHNEIIRGTGGEAYACIETDALGRAARCPVCGNEDELAGELCPVCLTPIVNRCLRASCRRISDGKSRYCSVCSAPTVFFSEGILADWSECEREKSKEK